MSNIITFVNLWGSTTYAADGTPSRTYTSLTSAGSPHYSTPWSMVDRRYMAIEIDSSSGGLLVATMTLQRALIPSSIDYPLVAGVKWYDVPTAEVALIDPAGGGESDIVEVQGSASNVYRIKATVGTTGDAWVAISIKD